jgi:hypothetical protein
VKPILAKESYRGGSTINFQVKFSAEEERWSQLTINTHEDGPRSTLLTYSINNEAPVPCSEAPWVQGLIKACGGEYCAAKLRTFELHQENDEFWYALTNERKEGIKRDFTAILSMFNHQPGDCIVMPHTAPGPRFKDDGSIESKPSVINVLEF